MESTFAKQIALIENDFIPPVVKTGNLESVRTVADVRDAVEAYFLLVTSPEIPHGSVFNIGGNFTTTGNVSHAGLTMTSGTDIDQVYSVTKSITLTTSWQDTGIIFSNLATGSYMVQVAVNDSSVGGQHYTEMYTGVMSWYGSTTNSAVTDEILLHRAGHAPNNGDIFLRTARVTGNTSPNLHMEIRGSTNNTGASNYVFKFRRMI